LCYLAGPTVTVSNLILFEENTEQSKKINKYKICPFITARYFSSERLRKDHGPDPKRTAGSVNKSAASHYFVYYLLKSNNAYAFCDQRDFDTKTYSIV